MLYLWAPGSYCIGRKGIGCWRYRRGIRVYGGELQTTSGAVPDRLKIGTHAWSYDSTVLSQARRGVVGYDSLPGQVLCETSLTDQTCIRYQHQNTEFGSPADLTFALDNDFYPTHARL